MRQPDFRYWSEQQPIFVNYGRNSRISKSIRDLASYLGSEHKPLAVGRNAKVKENYEDNGECDSNDVLSIS